MVYLFATLMTNINAIILKLRDVYKRQGLGYAEKDSGTSFPRSYLWMQCNDFSEPCSVMVSICLLYTSRIIIHRFMASFSVVPVKKLRKLQIN